MSTINKNNEDVLINLERCTGCLNCQLICSLAFTKTFSPAQSRIIIDCANGREIHFTEDCNQCNLCVKYCVYGALTLRES